MTDEILAEILALYYRTPLCGYRAIAVTVEYDLPDDERRFLEERGVVYIEHAQGGFTVLFAEWQREVRDAHLKFIKSTKRFVSILTPDTKPAPSRAARRGGRRGANRAAS